MLRNFDIDSATSLGASANGTAVSVDKTKYFAIACVISSASSLNGTLKMQASLYSGIAADIPSGSWIDATPATTVTVDGGTLFEAAMAQYKWVRIVYTRTGGSGALTTTFNENQ